MTVENCTHSCVNCTVTSYDNRFFEYFRMSQAQFAHILSILKPSITYRISRKTCKLSDILLFGCPRYASLPASTVTRLWHDNNKTKALIGQEHGWRAVSRREIAPEAIERGTARVSRAGEKKSLIGLVGYRAISRSEYRLM